MRYAYFLVEGPHDVEAVGRILKHHGAERVKLKTLLDDFWQPLVPQTFPFEDDMMKRVPVPTFFQGTDFSVAVQSAGGDGAKFIETLARLSKPAISKLFKVNKLTAVGLFCDADVTHPMQRCQSIVQELTGKAEQISQFAEILASIEEPGQVTDGPPRSGLYIFPDNEGTGTLEHLLLDCAAETYSDLLMTARDYVGTVPAEFKKKWHPSDENKVLVGCIANVLRPGKANQVSIQDNKWICKETLHLPQVDRLNQFIIELLAL
jgi:hypothetical protein